MPSTGPNSILVIDDDPRVAKILVETLAQEEEFSPSACHSAGEGFREYLEGKGKYRTLLVDEALGRAKGLHLIRLIRLLDQETTLILVSGVADLDAAVAALRGGADDFISKPFKPWDLKARVQTAVNRRSLVARKHRAKVLEPAGPGREGGEILEQVLAGLPPPVEEGLARWIPAIEKTVLHRPGFAAQVAERAMNAARKLSVRENFPSSLGRAAALQLLGIGGWEPLLARETLSHSRNWQDSWRSILLEGADFLEALEGKDGPSAQVLESAAAPAGGDPARKAGREEAVLGRLLLLATFFTAAEGWKTREGKKPEPPSLLEEWGQEAGFPLDPELVRAFF